MNAGGDAGTGPVLVVDDDAVLRRLIELSLADDGFAVVVAGDAAGAVAMAARRTPAAVVLDYRLPDGDGGSVVDAIRAACGRAVPVVLITADNAKALAIDSGFHAASALPACAK